MTKAKRRVRTHYVRPITAAPVYDVVESTGNKVIPLPWDVYFLNIAEAVKLRSSCMRRQVGAVIVKDKRLLSTGYNGTPRGITNCNDGGCPRCNSKAPSGTALDECICVHAETNAIAQAAKAGICIDGGTMYCTLFPCKDCAKLMINAGIIEVIIGSDNYNADVIAQAMKLFVEAAIRVVCGDTGTDADLDAYVKGRPMRHG